MMKTAKRVAEAEIVRSSEDSHTIKLIWSTGYTGLRSEWGEKFYEALDMSPEAVNLTRLNSGNAPFLTEHERDVKVQLGVIKRAWLEDGLGYAEVKLSKHRNQDLVNDILDGVLSSVSVGYSIEQFEETGKQSGIPVMTARRWTPVEVSVVSSNFDLGAVILRSNEDESLVEIINTQTRESTMSEEELEKIKADAIAEYEAKKQAEAEEQAKLEAEENERKAKEEQEKLEAEQQETERKQAIELQVRAASLPEDQTKELIQEFQTRNLDSTQITIELFERMKTAQTPKEKQMNKQELLAQALLNRVNARRFPADKSNPYRGESLVKICEAVVQRNAGESETAFATRAIASTDVQELLANVANKLVQGETEEKFAYEKITREQPLRDFKATKAIRFSASPLAAKASETGDYTDAALTDSAEEIQLKDLGKLYKISHVAMINDDIGAFAQLEKEAQKMGKRAVEKQLFDMLNANAALSDTKTLFHADHGNVLTASAAPSTTTLNSVEQLMAAFKDDSNNPLDLKTKYLVVPPSLAMAAHQVANQILASSSSNVNPWAGNIEVIVSSRITQVGGKDCWFAIAQDSPLVHGVMQGQGDSVEIASEYDFNSKNYKMRVTMPSDVAPSSYKGIVRVVLA